jgi:hypothetical protein
MFRNLVQMQDGNQNPRPLLQILVELSEREPKVGYFMLYFLKARYVINNLNDININLVIIFNSNLDGLKIPTSVCVLYEEFCKTTEKNLTDILLTDMKVI